MGRPDGDQGPPVRNPEHRVPTASPAWVVRDAKDGSPCPELRCDDHRTAECSFPKGMQPCNAALLQRCIQDMISPPLKAVATFPISLHLQQVKQASEGGPVLWHALCFFLGRQVINGAGE